MAFMPSFCASIDALIDKAQKDGMNAIAVTDHGHMFGIKEFFNKVSKKNGKPLGAIKDLEKEQKALKGKEALSTEEQARLQEIPSLIEAEKKKIFKPIIGCECYCAHCGDIFRRSQWFIRGERIPVWRCISRLEKKKSGIDCPSRTLYETDLQAAVVMAFNQLVEQKEEFLPGMRLAMERMLGQSNSPRVTEIDKQLEVLQKELLKKANAKQGFDSLADEIDALREEKQTLLMEDAGRAGLRQRLTELEEFLDGQVTGLTDYYEAMVRQLVERITVYDDHLAFEFKCGIETEVQM